MENYLAQAQGSDHRGQFDFVVYTINLISSVKTVQRYLADPKSRPWYRKISDYLALFLDATGAGDGIQRFVIFMSTLQNFVLGAILIFTRRSWSCCPHTSAYIITTLLGFHGLYVSLPNTKAVGS